LGKKTITGLYYFYNGYTTAMSAYEISFDGETTVFAELVEYIKTAFKIQNSETSWAGLILEECEKNEEKAFDLFYDYLKEFKASLPQSANPRTTSSAINNMTSPTHIQALLAFFTEHAPDQEEHQKAILFCREASLWPQAYQAFSSLREKTNQCTNPIQQAHYLMLESTYKTLFNLACEQSPQQNRPFDLDSPFYIGEIALTLAETLDILEAFTQHMSAPTPQETDK
jgi:hypothetical protein